MRRLTLLVLLVAAMVAAASPALAHRRATHREAAAIGKVVHAYIAKKHSPVARDAKITSVTVSTANRSYALVRLRSHRAGPSKMLMHTKNHKWRVLGYAVGAFHCGLAPAKVFKDLLGNAHACLPGGY
ncbi:MAG TPA: hypothetical protein VFR49_10485 [Solirubrobacteraceae bacterium]|nr:hypothetical protein [Solirubrobacteraceae bacterium]